MTPFFNNSAPANSSVPETSSADIGLWVTMGLTMGAAAVFAFAILFILHCCGKKNEESRRLLDTVHVPTTLTY